MNKEQHKPIRVLHVHGDLVAGGGQTLSREWLRASDRSVIDPYVVVLSEPTTLQESFEKAGIPVTRIFGSRLMQIFKLAKFIRANGIDVVHTQSEPDRKIGHWASLITRRPVIAHLHSEWVYFAKPSEEEKLIKRIRANAAFLIRRISEKSVVQLVATSDLVKDAFSNFTEKPIITVEPGVAVSLLTSDQREKYREALKVVDDELVIVNLSRLDAVKNLEDFILAVSKLSKEVKVRAFIAGEGPLREKLSNLISEKGLYREVELLRALDDPIELLGAADIFLATSTYESFGISVLEALSAGIPVVAYDLDVYGRYDGAVSCVEVGNVEGLVAECLRFANNPSEIESRRKLASQAAEKYSINVGTQALVEIDQMYASKNKN